MAKKLKRGKFRRKKLLSTLHTGSGKLWAPLSLVAISLILSFLNYQPGTWLTGWDNLHPEFNFSLNIRRSLFAVWQEYQGLGLLGGMAHAADLPRQLILLFLNSLGVPAQILRYIWTFGMLAIGPLGVYFFIKNHLLRTTPKPLGLAGLIKSKIFKNKPVSTPIPFDLSTKTLAAFLGGLFYLLNLSTVQTFFVPFETFTSFYGFFPWLILVTANYLYHPSRRSYLYLVIIYILSTPSFYVETLFVVLLLCLLPCFAVAQKAKAGLLTFSTILITQAFWLLPVIFFVLTNGRVGEQAKINLLATPETYLRNLEFANLKDLSLLKGYLLNFLDLGPNQKFTYLLQPWREHLKNPLINLLGYLNFILILTGAYYAFKKRLKTSSSLIIMALICLFFLLGGGLLINNKIPLIGELFRSPFTKFSTPLAFTYSIFFSIGSIFILDLFSFLHHRLTYTFTLFTLSLLLLIFVSPAFSGQLISPNMKLKIPEEYFETFKFFKNQDPNSRIANFPQYTFWGWNFYSWGYRGSGFLWYGIRQPILDRAFDVWEKQNENYYQKINAALYSENQEAFEEQIKKYAINWILIDKFVISPQKNQHLKNQALINMLNSSNLFKLEKNINNKILIYKSNINNRVNNFISLTPVSNTQSFPFKDISLRPNTNWKKEKNSLTYTKDFSSDGSASLPAGMAAWVAALPSQTPTEGLSSDSVSATGGDSSDVGPVLFSLPSYTQTENLVPVEISYKKLPQQILLKFSPLLPTIHLQDTQFTLKSQPNYVYLNTTDLSSSLILEINRQYFELLLPGELATQPIFYPLTSTYLPTRNHISVKLYSGNPKQTINLTNALKNAVAYQCYTNKKDRKIEKVVFSDSISILGTDVVGCLSVPLPTFVPPGLISTNYTYFSPTQTPANTNITPPNLSSSTTPPQPLQPKTLPFTTRQFSPLTLEKQQLNLILEANNTKSIQEITYQNITANLHPLLDLTTFTLNQIPGQAWDLSSKGLLSDSGSATGVDSSDVGPVLTLSLPLANSPFNITQTPNNNQLLPQIINCSQFRSGSLKKTVSSQAINYFSQNATACDTLDLRHLPHSTNYLIQVDYQHQKGLPMTVCLENHSTGRCDVFERLMATHPERPDRLSGGGANNKKVSFVVESNNIQSLIQPISNPNEPPGYSLHLYNQSIGNRPTESSIKKISITPIPLKFLKNISMEGFSSDGSASLPAGMAAWVAALPSVDSSEVEPTQASLIGTDLATGGDCSDCETRPSFSSTHPAEFLYTLSINNPAPSTLNLYQTYSPYWLAIKVDKKNANLSLFKLIFKTPLLLIKGQTLTGAPLDNSGAGPLGHRAEGWSDLDRSTSWHNSWQLPEGEHHLILVYLPQYLEFLGFLLLPLLIIPTIKTRSSKSQPANKHPRA